MSKFVVLDLSTNLYLSDAKRFDAVWQSDIHFYDTYASAMMDLCSACIRFKVNGSYYEVIEVNNVTEE